MMLYKCIAQGSNVRFFTAMSSFNPQYKFISKAETIAGEEGVSSYSYFSSLLEVAHNQAPLNVIRDKVTCFFKEFFSPFYHASIKALACACASPLRTAARLPDPVGMMKQNPWHFVEKGGPTGGMVFVEQFANSAFKHMTGSFYGALFLSANLGAVLDLTTRYKLHELRSMPVAFITKSIIAADLRNFDSIQATSNDGDKIASTFYFLRSRLVDAIAIQGIQKNGAFKLRMQDIPIVLHAFKRNAVGSTLYICLQQELSKWIKSTSSSRI